MLLSKVEERSASDRVTSVDHEAGSTRSSTRISEWSNAPARAPRRRPSAAPGWGWSGRRGDATTRSARAAQVPRRGGGGARRSGVPTRTGNRRWWPRCATRPEGRTGRESREPATLSVKVQGANGSSIVNSYPDSGQSPTSERPSGPCNATTAVAHRMHRHRVDDHLQVCSSGAPLEMDANARDMWSFTDSSANVAT